MLYFKRIFCALLSAALIFSGCSSNGEQSKNDSFSSDTTENSSTNPEKTDSSQNTTASKTTSATTTTTTRATLTDVVTRENKPAKVNVGEYNYPFSLTGFDSVVSVEDFKEFLDELSLLTSNNDFSLSFCYKNMDTGAEIDYNQYQDFMTCSTIKAPYIKSLLESGVDLEQNITKYSKFTGDTGYTASLENGARISVRELMKRAVSYSDNTAYYLLHNYFGYYQYNANQTRLSNNCYLGSSWIFTHCTAQEMLKNYADIYEFIKSDPNGSFLKELMSADDVDVNMQIRYALEPKYTVCEKYGSEFGSWGEKNQFHACSIVFAESPFVLVVFTDQLPETEKSAEIFKKLAVVFYKINSVVI